MRRFGADANDPWVHVIDPYAEAAVLHAHGDNLLGMSAARGASGIDGTAPLATAGFTTTLGRWSSREAFELGGAGGARVRLAPHVARASARSRAVVRPRRSPGSASRATSRPCAAGDDDAENGVAAVGRMRLGRSDGVRLLTNVATRDGLDPVLARALVDAPLEPASGFLVDEGTTGGAGLVVPWGACRHHVGRRRWRRHAPRARRGARGRRAPGSLRLLDATGDGRASPRARGRRRVARARFRRRSLRRTSATALSKAILNIVSRLLLACSARQWLY